MERRISFSLSFVTTDISEDGSKKIKLCTFAGTLFTVTICFSNAFFVSLSILIVLDSQVSFLINCSTMMVFIERKLNFKIGSKLIEERMAIVYIYSLSDRYLDQKQLFEMAKMQPLIEYYKKTCTSCEEGGGRDCKIQTSKQSKRIITNYCESIIKSERNIFRLLSSCNCPNLYFLHFVGRPL